MNISFNLTENCEYGLSDNSINEKKSDISVPMDLLFLLNLSNLLITQPITIFFDNDFDSNINH